MNSAPIPCNDRRNKGRGLVRLSNTFQAAKSFFHVFPNETIPNASIARNFLSSIENVLRTSLEKLLSAVSARKNRALYDKIREKLAFLNSVHFQEEEPNGEESSTSDLKKITLELLFQHNTEMFEPFEMACKTRSIKTVLASLDGIQRLLSCGYFSTPKGAAVDTCSSVLVDSVSQHSSEEHKPDEKSSQWNLEPIISSSHLNLIDKVLHNVMTLAEYPDEAVQLQVVRCILTAITASQTDKIHGETLVRAVSNIFSLYGRTKCIQNQRTAQAALTQIINSLMSCIGNQSVNDINTVTEQSEKQHASNTLNLTRLEADQCRPRLSRTISLSFPRQKTENLFLYRSKSLNRNIASHDACKTFETDETQVKRETSQGVPHLKSDITCSNYCKTFTTPVKISASSLHDFEGIVTSMECKEREIPTQSIHLENGKGQVINNKWHDSTLYSDTENDCPEHQMGKKEKDILIKDAIQIFSLLCSFTMESDPQDNNTKYDSPSLRVKKLSLELLVSIFQNHSFFLKSIVSFVDCIRNELFISLITNCVSHIPKIFGLSMSLFSVIYKQFQDVLARELALFVHFVLVHLLESWNSSYEHKQHVLQVLHTISSDPHFVVELYINFDCQVNENHVFFRVVQSLCCIVKLNGLSDIPHFGVTQEQHLTLQKMALEVLVNLLKNLSLWVERCCEEKHPSPAPESEIFEKNKEIECIDNNQLPSAPEKKNVYTNEEVILTRTPQTNCRNFHTFLLDQQRHRKQVLHDFIEIFNKDPSKGLELIIRDKYIQDSPEDVAMFFLRTPTLKKNAIGDYLGSNKPFNVQVLRALVSQLDFRHLEIDTAIKKFLSTFRLPGEAQKIDRIMECFACKYVQDNPGKFASADCAYVLSFSLIMLHTDAHTSSIKPQNKMTVDMFIRNNRGINDNADLPSEYLENLYYRVVAEEWTLEENDHTHSKLDASEHRTSSAHSGFTITSTFDAQQPFFDGIVSALGFSNAGRKKFEQFLKESKGIVTKTTLELKHRMQQEGIYQRTPDFLVTLDSKNSVDRQTMYSSLFPSEESTTTSNSNFYGYIRATDEFVDQVKFLFLTIHCHLFQMMKTLLTPEITETLLLLLFDMLESVLLITWKFNLVNEAGSYLSHITEFISLSFKMSLKSLNETVLPSAQIQCLQFLFNTLLTKKFYLVAEQCWKPILECCSQLNNLYQMDSSLSGKSSFQMRPLIPTLSSSSSSLSQKKIEKSLEKNELESSNNHTPNIFLSDINYELKEDDNLIKSDIPAVLPLLFSTDSLRNALGFGKSIKSEANKDFVDHSDINHETPSRFFRTKFNTNYNMIRAAVSHTQIDSLFLASTSFSSSSIVAFIKCLCDVSKEELRMKQPRIFSLQKLVEVADYNMNRIRLIWFKIWEVLVDYFVQVASHVSLYERIDIGLYAVDSLRQLTIRFLEKDELSSYSFQEEFLKPFLLLMESTAVDGAIKLFLVEILKQIIQIRAPNIRSGWKCIFRILEIVPVFESNNTALCQDAFRVLIIILTDHFVTVYACYVKEIIKTLTSFAMHTHHINVSKDDSSFSLAFLTLHYIEALTVILSGQAYATYCSALHQTPHRDILQMENKILNFKGSAENESDAVANVADQSRQGHIKLPTSKVFHFHMTPQFEDLETEIHTYVSLLKQLRSFQQHGQPCCSPHQNFEIHEITPSHHALTQQDEKLHILLCQLQSHHSSHIFPLLTCLYHLATLNSTKNYVVHQQALITLFRLFHHIATQLFNEDMWKMCIQGILFPFFDDLLLYFQQPQESSTPSNLQNNENTTDSEVSVLQRDNSNMSEKSPNSSQTLSQCVSPHQFYSLCLDLLLELIDHHFAILKRYFTEFLSLIGSCVRGTNLEIVSHLAVQVLGKIIDRTATRLSLADWDVVISALENLFQNTNSKELLNGLSEFSYSTPATTLSDDLCHLNRPSNSAVLDNDASAKTSRKESLFVSLPFSSEEIIRNCATRLFLIDLISVSLFSHINCLNFSLINRVLSLLLEAFNFSRSFNRQIAWRYYLKTIGFLKFTQKLPALLKQERESLKAIFLYLFAFLNTPNPSKSSPDILCASEKLVTAIEGLVNDISERSQFLHMANFPTAPFLDISEVELKKIYVTETENEIAVIGDIISHTMLEGLKKLPDDIFKLYARRLFVSLLGLTSFKSTILRQATMSVLISRISPLLEDALTVTKHHVEKQTEFTTQANPISFPNNLFSSPPPPSNV